MPGIDPKSVVVASDGALATSLEDEVVVYNDETESYQGLTGIGPDVWESIQEPTEVREVQRRVVESYDVDPERGERDVLEFLQELAEYDLLIEVDDERD
ncbi:MAG: PqqD family protein [Haloferacaceae archaeon]